MKESVPSHVLRNCMVIYLGGFSKKFYTVYAIPLSLSLCSIYLLNKAA